LPLDALRRLRWQPLCFTRLPVALMCELQAQVQVTSLLLLLAQQRSRQKLCQRQQVYSVQLGRVQPLVWEAQAGVARHAHEGLIDAT